MPKSGVLRLVRPSDLVHHRRQLRPLFRHELNSRARFACVKIDPRLIPNLESGRLGREDALNAQRAGNPESLALAEYYGPQTERGYDACHSLSIGEG
jgi:hypothetical protein